jgi:hypothetical protein
MQSDKNFKLLHTRLAEKYRPIPDAKPDAVIDASVRFDAPSVEPKDEPPSPPNPFVPTPWKWVDPKDVSPREFLYGTHYIREFLSVGFGPWRGQDHQAHGRGRSHGKRPRAAWREAGQEA